MKHLLLTTIAAVMLVGCGESQQSGPQAEPVEHIAEAAKLEPPTAETPDTSILGAAFKDIEVVKQHLDAGGDVNVKDENSLTPLDQAIQRKKTETANLLRKHGGKRGAAYSIHVAAKGDIEAVKQHLAAGVDVNAKSEDGGTPLLYAAAYGHRKIVELLITAGADVNVKNEKGKTTLHFAVLNGRKVIAELLIAKGADVNAKDEAGETPLDATYVFNKTETADLLRKHGGKMGKELKTILK